MKHLGFAFETTRSRPRVGAQVSKSAVSSEASGVKSISLNQSVHKDDVPYWTFEDVAPAVRRSDIRNWLITVGLHRSEDYLIDPEVQIIRMGLGWERGADIDASAVLFDENSRPADVVWYKKLRSTCGSVFHSGDNVNGIGEGDDEVITVALSEIPFHVHYVLFTVCVFSFDMSFADIRHAYVRMMNGGEKFRNHEMCRLSLSQMSGHAMLMGLLTRNGAYWNFRALGTPATGRTVMELLQNSRNLQYLSNSPSTRPELRCVTVTVVKGMDLAPKDHSGFFRKVTSSDPYFIIRHKNRKYTSEYKPQTLAPEWRSPPFEMGWITEAETKPLKIEVFDYDAIGTDDFMGSVRIPGYSLFDLGVGEHTFWFILQDSKKKEYRNEKVSGRILVHLKIEGPSTKQSAL